MVSSNVEPWVVAMVVGSNKTSTRPDRPALKGIISLAVWDQAANWPQNGCQIPLLSHNWYVGSIFS